MAHFAKLDEHGIVTQVIVVANAELIDNGVESEAKGIAFCTALLSGQWKQTSYSGRIKKNFAGIGFAYDPQRDAFVPPQPFASWLLDASCRWTPPVPHPGDGKRHLWDEAAQMWSEAPTDSPAQ